MRYRKLGNTDMNVSVIGFGCWAMGGDVWGEVEDRESIEAIQYALDQGVNLFDTAPVYGMGHSEEVLAKALGAKRKDVYIATKAGLEWNDQHNKIWRNSTKERIFKEVEDSLRRLKTDYIDLYQIHWPDQETPFEETMEALDQLIQDGKVRYIGVSNFNVEQMEACRKVRPIHTLQPPYHLFRRDIEQDILPYCKEHDIGVLAYGPMAHGLLTGKITPETTFPPSDWRSRNVLFREESLKLRLPIIDRLKELAQSYNHTLIDLAISWVLAQEGVTVALVGAKRRSQVEKNLPAADWILDESILKEVEQILKDDHPITTWGGPPHRSQITQG
ncbi:MAG: aldo/keto reductase [Bacillaceae bacterium]|nr:aldo/keto reductase [Bacillaceae bacterium]